MLDKNKWKNHACYAMMDEASEQTAERAGVYIAQCMAGAAA
jgi:hypothetical protein